MTDALSNDIRHEANTALLEVDKGLRSVRIGDQCEAIVKLPALMEKFPFPVLINVAFLKLADLFRTGTNLLRLNILKVVQLCDKHLTKITNCDEFVRRIYSVMHSNDPVARAVTLRVFGSSSVIMGDRRNIHHSIHRSLESNDRVEVEAAIFATTQLCPHSKLFASGVCEKIAIMVQGLSTPIEMKLKLIPILQQMHHDIGMASQVRDLCVKLLAAYPSLPFVTVILPILTKLSVTTLVDVSAQVHLLLAYVQGDVRHKVRMVALQNLLYTARHAPQSWSKWSVQTLVEVVDRLSNEKEKESVLRVLFSLSASTAVHTLTVHRDTFLAHCYSHNLNIVTFSLGVMSNCTIATAGRADHAHDLEALGRHLLESLLTIQLSALRGSRPLSVLLSSLVKVAKHTDIATMAQNTIVLLLPKFPCSHVILGCRALSAMVKSSDDGQITPKLLRYLQECSHDNQQEIMLPVATILIERQSVLACSDPARRAILPSLHSSLWSAPPWLAYKVARKASIMGFHELAAPVYLKLTGHVTSSKYRNWLYGLEQFSRAQLFLHGHTSSSSLLPALSKVSAVMNNTFLLIKTSGPPSSFPMDYLEVLTSLYDAHIRLLSTCVSVKIVPPSSVSASGNLEHKFTPCLQQFCTVAECLSTLYSSLFDGDCATLEYIALLQQSCLLMANAISSIAFSLKPLCSPKEGPARGTELSGEFSSKYMLGRVCSDVLKSVETAASFLKIVPLGEEHVQALTECSVKMLSVPVLLPHCFFRALQHTTVKLVLSPALPAVGQSIMVQLNSHMTLSVEGVVEHNGRTRQYRFPKAVHIRAVPKVEKLLSHDAKTPSLCVLERTEQIQQDYFHAEFLFTLPVAAYYTITIQSDLLDQNHTVWRTGQSTAMSVLVDTEENLKQHQLRQKEPSNIISIPVSNKSQKV